MTEATRYKVHSSYIWLSGIQGALSLLFFFVLMSFGVGASLIAELGDLSDGGFAAVLVLIFLIVTFLVIAGLIFLLQYFSYKHLWYELGAAEFSLYSGILSKKRVHVPYQRVQSVNQRATLIQRIAGVCTVHIDTAGGAQNKAVVVPYLRKTDAEWLRTQLFYRKQAVMAPASPAEAAPTAPPPPLGEPHAAPPPPVGAPLLTPELMPPAASSTGLPVSALPTGQPVPLPPPPVGSPVMAAALPAQPSLTQGGLPGAYDEGNVLDAPAAAMADMRGVFGGEGFDLGKVSYSYRLTNKELAFTGMSNSSGFIVIGISGFATLFGLIFTVLAPALVEAILDAGESLTLEPSAGILMPLILVGAISLVIVTWVSSIVGTCISYGGFTARRRGSRVEVEYGILQHRFDGVDIDRVQSVIIRQSFIRRLIGYCEISLGKINALTDAQKQNQAQTGVIQKGLVVHPFVKLTRVPEILAGLVPEYAEVPTNTIKLPKVALRRALLRRGILQNGAFWTALIVAVVHICLSIVLSNNAGELMVVNLIALALYILCLLAIIFEAIAAVLWHRRSSFAYNQHFMQISNGGYSFESISFPRRKIQFGYIKTNPFQRLSKVKTINVTTAAGIGGTTMRLVDADEAEANAWLEWLIPRRR
ncbi:MAG: PH domain-containing protein [Coriobacteriia bacterium]|nr:PH domain-containing protein [Coriobacteriia bacterium]